MNVVRSKSEAAACAIPPAPFGRPAYRGPPFGRGRDVAGVRWPLGPRAPWGAVFRPRAAASGVLRFGECGGLRLAHHSRKHPPDSLEAAGIGFTARVLSFRVPSGRRALRPRGHCACPALLASLRVLVLRFGALRVLVLFLSPRPRGLAGAFLLSSMRIGVDWRAARALGPLRAPFALNYVKFHSDLSRSFLALFCQFSP